MSDYLLLADAVAPPEAVCSLAQGAVVAGCAVVVFLIFGLILAIPILRGRKLKHRCACAASRDVMRILEERERAALEAARYSPDTVDVNNLPQTSPELAEYARTASRDGAQPDAGSQPRPRS